MYKTPDVTPQQPLCYRYSTAIQNRVNRTMSPNLAMRNANAMHFSSPTQHLSI